MKFKDIGVVVAVGIFSAIVSIFASGLLIPSSDRNQKVEVIGPISSEFERPSKEYFNQDSVNPTQEIQIGQDEGSNPFSGN